jgi:hypothetical protein
MHRRRQGGGAGLLGPITVTLVVALAVCLFAIHFRAYYGAATDVRRLSPLNWLLRPTGPVGLAAGALGGAMFVCNGVYLFRRSGIGRRILPGSRRSWMNWHVFTGLCSAPLVLVHGGFTVRNSVGGHALATLAVVIISGVGGRYLFSKVALKDGRADGSRVTVSLFSSWRVVHRWLALLLIVLASIHVAVSLGYGSFDFARVGIFAGDGR